MTVIGVGGRRDILDDDLVEPHLECGPSIRIDDDIIALLDTHHRAASPSSPKHAGVQTRVHDEGAAFIVARQQSLRH